MLKEWNPYKRRWDVCGYHPWDEIQPIGGEEKAKAVRHIVTKFEGTLDKVIYVGDSITDIQALQLVKAGGGLTISFNGNHYAVANADIAVLAEHTIITSIMVDVYTSLGRNQLLNLVKNWSPTALFNATVDRTLVNLLHHLYPKTLPRVEVVDASNVEELGQASNLFRRSVRGQKIGRLG